MAKTFKKHKKIGKRATARNKHTSKSSFMKVDIEKDIPSFEKMLRKSPVTIVMVYLGWCGHCQKAKPGFMEVAKQNHPGVNFAMLNGDIQDKTSLKNVKVEGVPEFVVNVSSNGNIQSTKVPISYEKDSIERLANASTNTLKQMSALPTTFAISNKEPANILANIKKNNANKNVNRTIDEEALPVPNSSDELMFDMEEMTKEPTKVSKPTNALSMSGPIMINSLNPLSTTSPLATLMNISRENKNKMTGGGSHPQPHQDPTHPGMFVVNIPGKKLVRGKYSKVAKAIREYEHSLTK
jgi:thiol-disulfide isomerase/thioredoxin